jgi:hypothetical protein
MDLQTRMIHLLPATTLATDAARNQCPDQLNPVENANKSFDRSTLLTALS